MRSRLPFISLGDLESHARSWARRARRAEQLRVDDRPVLALLNVVDFTEFYGVERFGLMLDLFCAYARDEGADPYLLGVIGWVDDRNVDLCNRLPLHGVTGYGLLPTWRGPRLQHYPELIEERVKEWYAVQRRIRVPFFPVVCAGWDATTRSRKVPGLPPLGYPYTPVVVGDEPGCFRRFLEHAIEFNRAHAPRADLVFLHALNEWTEGAVLEPNTRQGDSFLRVLGEFRAAPSVSGVR